MKSARHNVIFFLFARKKLPSNSSQFRHTHTHKRLLVCGLHFRSQHVIAIWRLPLQIRHRESQFGRVVVAAAHVHAMNML